MADVGVSPTAGAGCLPTLTPDRVTCGSGGVAAIEVDAGDGDDSVLIATTLPSRLLGGDGDDELTGGAGADLLDAGTGSDYADGDDTILMRDRSVDSVLCGAGRDRARAEVLDTLEPSCERVDWYSRSAARPG